MAQLFRRILCPIDFDENSLTALDIAIQVATQNGAAIYLAHVVPLPLGASEMVPIPSEPFPVWEQDAKSKLEAIAKERIGSKLQCEVVTRSGLASDSIVGLEAEMGIDLVVMATHGRQPLGSGSFFSGERR
jgi:nucleotide-binding universal stress UspA family protein